MFIENCMVKLNLKEISKKFLFFVKLFEIVCDLILVDFNRNQIRSRRNRTKRTRDAEAHCQVAPHEDWRVRCDQRVKKFEKYRFFIF